MQLNLQHVFSDEIELPWDNLLKESHFKSPFQKFGYLRQWWQTMGGGEWHEGKLNLVLATQEDDLIGIAPFFEINFEGKNSLLFVGSVEISDYLDFIVKPENHNTFLVELFRYLLKNSQNWQQIVLYNLLEDSASIPLIKEIIPSMGLNWQVDKIEPALYIPMPASWDEYLQNIEKKQRHEIRRKLRKAEEIALSIQLHVCDGKNNLDAEISSFLDLMGRDEEKAKFLSPAMRPHMHQMMHWAAKEGILHLSFLKINNQNASGYLCFDYNNCIWVYNSGFDKKFWDYSPGWIHLSKLIQWAIDHGRELADMMRGGEAYKYRFGGIERFVYKVTIS